MHFGAAAGIPIAMERGVSDDLRDGRDLRDRRGDGERDWRDLRDRRGDDERDGRDLRDWRLSRSPRGSRGSSSNEIVAANEITSRTEFGA